MAGSVISILHGAAFPARNKEREQQPGRCGPRWNLDRSSLDALLGALHPDRETASRKYTALHERLVRFFQWNSVEESDALADETLDRLARRITADNANQLQNGEAPTDAVKEPEKFAAGIARLLLHEHWRRVQRQEHALQAVQQQDLAAKAADAQHLEALTAALDHCLRKLTPAQRELIQKYYGAEGLNQIETRKQLASQMNISVNALRNRAMRIRADLEESAANALRKPSHLKT